MKLIESINFVPFYEKVKDQTMSAPMAYQLSRIYKAAKEDTDFYQEKLRAILFEYGELDENGNLIPVDDGNGIKLKPDTQEDCIKAITELQNTDSTISFKPISPEGLSNLTVTPGDIESIMGFLSQE